MRFLDSLVEGSKFRVAHPRQRSLNGREMPRALVFQVTKVYPMSPCITISKAIHSPWPKAEKGFYSLGPRTPILSPKEPDPTEEEVLRFIGVTRKKRIVGYRLLWDGKVDLRKLIPPRAIAVAKIMYMVGRTEYETKELISLLEKHFSRFYPGKAQSQVQWSFWSCKNLMLDSGVIAEIVDSPPIPAEISDANLQEVVN